jgi:ssDNA-binding Zn-finger/Zn-ribbon topoisomerase 1
MCLFLKSTFQKGFDFCGAYPDCPCKELIDYQLKMPNRVEILESQNRLKEIGWEQWLIEMKENYSCPQCNTVNTAYNLVCRKCGYAPGSKLLTDIKI